MKRANGLMPHIAAIDNLQCAFVRARRGHSRSTEVAEFARNLPRELERMRAELLAGDIEVGSYHVFSIRDPKPRVIHAPRFRERVLHHAIMNACEPRIDRYLISDTFACRPGRGTGAARARAWQFVRRYDFVLKMDIKSYFDSIDHAVLRARLARLFAEKAVRAMFDRVLDSHGSQPGKGLPIGTLLSQHFANLYLGALDHHVKKVLRVPGYVRYMDDFLLFADDRERLRHWRDQVVAWVRDELCLTVKSNIVLTRCARGVTFLGARIHKTHLRLSGERVRRFRRAVRTVLTEMRDRRESERRGADRLTALFAHAAAVRSGGMRRRFLRTLVADGLLPEEPLASTPGSPTLSAATGHAARSG